MTPVLEIQTEAQTYRAARSVISFDKARSLAARYGSPLLVVSRSTLVRTYRALKAALPGVDLFYAAKANPDKAILSTLRKEGAFVDVCSQGEAKMALKAGFRPDQMIHTHPCKTMANLVECQRMGINWFTIDSPYELPKLQQFAPDANLLLRLAASGASSVIDLSAKFGAHPSDAPALLTRAARMGLKVRGLSFHVGSQCLSPDDYRSALQMARRVWDQAVELGQPLELLDIGGGMPAPYREAILSIESFGKAVTQALDETFGDINPRIIAEPGRSLCAEAVTLITSVIGKSVRGGRNWYFIDDGLYGSFSGKVFDHADFRVIAEGEDVRPMQPCVIAGPTCDSTDVVARDQPMPNLEIGELLLVPTMGAYTSASASPFNGLDVARTVAVD